MFNFKSLLANPFAKMVHYRLQKEAKNAVKDQQSILNQLIKIGQRTVFGKDHGLDKVSDYASFKQAIPIRDYEGFTSYIELVKKGTPNVLWKGLPIYFAKTSGTTSGVKYIPITKDSIDNHYVAVVIEFKPVKLEVSHTVMLLLRK